MGKSPSTNQTSEAFAAEGRGVDATIADHGTIALLTPLTREAEEWCDEHLPEDAMRHGQAYAVEPRYVPPILVGLSEEGFAVKVC